MTTPAAIVRSILWNHAGRLAEYALMYATSVLIARGLGVMGNGDFAGLTTSAQLLFVLTSIGLETSLNRHIPRLGDAAQGVTRSLLRKALAVRFMGFAVAGTVLLLLSSSHQGILPEPLRPYLGLLLVYSFLRAMVSLVVITLTAQLRTETTSRVNVGVRFLELAAVVAILFWGMNLQRLMVVFISTSVLQIVCYSVAAKDLVRGRSLPAPFAPILTFGGIYWVNTVVDYFLGRQGDLLMLRYLLSDPIPVSLYDVAFSLVQVAVLGSTLGLGGVMFATFSRLAAEGKGGAHRMYGVMVRGVSLLTIPPAAFLLFHGATIVALMYSPSYAGAAVLVQGMAAFRIAARLFGGGENAEYALSMGLVSPLVGLSLLGAAVNIMLNFGLIPGFGAQGSVIASGAGNIAATAGGFLLIRRHGAHRLQLSSWIRIAFACCLASWLTPSLGIVPSAFSAALELLLYGAGAALLLFIVKPLDGMDVELAARINPRLGALASRFAPGRSRKGIEP